jgi:hypothetical protein
VPADAGWPFCLFPVAFGPARLHSALGKAMNLDDILAAPVPLGDFLRHPKQLQGWLYTDARDTVGFATLCRATLVNPREFSEEESEAREAFLLKEGFRCLLSRDQIEDVISNLRYRYPHPTPEQIEEALAFFLTHDSFIVT